MDANQSINQDETNKFLYNVLTVFFKRKRLILTFFLIIVTLSIVSSFTIQHYYLTDTKIRGESEHELKQTENPTKMVIIILSILLGMFCSLGLAYTIEYRNHSLNSPDELEKYVGITSLGSVPEIKLDTSSDTMSIQTKRILK